MHGKTFLFSDFLTLLWLLHGLDAISLIYEFVWSKMIFHLWIFCKQCGTIYFASVTLSVLSIYTTLYQVMGKFGLGKTCGILIIRKNSIDGSNWGENLFKEFGKRWKLKVRRAISLICRFVYFVKKCSRICKWNILWELLN